MLTIALLLQKYFIDVIWARAKNTSQQSTQPSPKGTVIVHVVHEPMQAALNAYGSCVTPSIVKHKELQGNPSPTKKK